MGRPDPIRGHGTRRVPEGCPSGVRSPALTGPARPEPG